MGVGGAHSSPAGLQVQVQLRKWRLALTAQALGRKREAEDGAEAMQDDGAGDRGEDEG